MQIGLYNSKLNLAVAMEYNKKQLPCLTNWQHWGAGEYVTGLEPGTNPPTGQRKAREDNQLIFLEPGESRSYELNISVLTQQKQINNFIAESWFYEEFYVFGFGPIQSPELIGLITKSYDWYACNADNGFCADNVRC